MANLLPGQWLPAAAQDQDQRSGNGNSPNEFALFASQGRDRQRKDGLRFGRSPITFHLHDKEGRARRSQPCLETLFGYSFNRLLDERCRNHLASIGLVVEGHGDSARVDDDQRLGTGILPRQNSQGVFNDRFDVLSAVDGANLFVNVDAEFYWPDFLKSFAVGLIVPDMNAEDFTLARNGSRFSDRKSWTLGKPNFDCRAEEELHPARFRLRVGNFEEHPARFQFDGYRRDVARLGRIR